ncbi:hypothetical protein LZ554_003236 [Drepanopeziza brunnea f. sp. 'monogermtubi']|nr:hypothetical protein LZ554_003236 [Drepanopeziza brunnea f. sp. 'monogermtubi']
MATEATTENIATTLIVPDDELNTVDTSSSQDAPPEQPVVNGTVGKLKQDAECAEPSTNSADVSVSGGSDTEASKTEISKSPGDDKGHVRTASSVKKVAAFKPVSVNKTFLAAKGSATAAPSKLGDKAAAGASPTQTPASASSALRPRLVAKSGSGLRDSAPRNTAAANGAKAGAAPDPSAVWNKNRPAPPVEPKRFTDEELKQRYGIHLATRLQSDEPGKQANWADIEDDDDDWAPETIEWTDGTKITLSQAEDPPAPVPEPAPAPAPAPKEIFVAKPKSPQPAQASAPPPVKPSGFGSGRAGLVLKGASEKPTLVAKPPGPPTPVKSPWASLPPVDKVAPVSIEPQQQQHTNSRFNQRDPNGFNGMPPPPAKEIAADDFSRSWREGSNTSRELYNSQSGRYEPVNDNRRGPMRNDARNDSRAHQPALLQRPPLHDGAPEPSAAFQTHRASGHEGYGRRRTSSNLSGGSGNLVRRMSRGHEMPPPHELSNVRRGSLAAVSDAPSSPRNFSPSGQHPNQRGYPAHPQGQHWQSSQQGQQSQSRAPPAESNSSPKPTNLNTVPATSAVSGAPAQTPAVPYEDPIEEQKKIMRATRELAIKRRQEEEAKEEAARKERIRIKLEAMGPPPESKKKKDAAKEELTTPKQIQSQEAAAAPPVQSQEQASAATQNDAKVKPSSDSAQKHAVISPVEEKPVATHTSNQDMRSNGAHQGRTMAPQTSQDGRPSSWQDNTAPSADRYQSWNAAPTPQSSSMNVWGPPTNDRTLGNGTFNPELSRVPDIHQSSHPGPIGPPNRGNAQFQQGRGRDPYGSRPAPIGPPNRYQGQLSRQDLEKKAAVARSGWGSLPQVLQHNESIEAKQHDLERAQKLKQIEQGILPEPVGPMIQETWRQVAINEDGSRGKIQTNITSVHDPQAWKSQEESTTRGGMFEDQEAARRQPIDPVGNQSRFNDGSQPPFNDAWRTQANVNASPAVRGSRFFPNNRDVRLEEQYALYDIPSSPSPPPPTMAGHPAYDGDIAHPHVSLPRPAPVVKLPPAPVMAPIGPPPKPVSFAQVVQAPAVPVINHNAGYQSRQNAHGYQDIRRQEQPTAGGWQDRISNLLGRKNSPPKSHALAVDSSSKNALELPKQQVGATVSLPSVGLGDLAFDNGAVESKPAAEECFEEQEMGSLPIVKVPHLAPPSAWNLAPSPSKSFPRKFQVSQVLTAEPLHFGQHIVNNIANLVIKLPGQDDPKSVTIAVAPRQRSDSRRGANSRGRGAQSSSSHPRGRGGRDASSGYPSTNHDNASVASNTNSGRGGRSSRSYGSSWGRNSTPVHT